MIQKKVCILGSFAVGKTSLTRQFVDGIFNEKYLTTVGVKIDNKLITVDEKQIKLLLWDIFGDESPQKINSNFLRGSSAFIIVADATRPDTGAIAMDYALSIQEAFPKAPYKIVLNKCDLVSKSEINVNFEELIRKNKNISFTSAKNGNGVHDLFLNLAKSFI